MDKVKKEVEGKTNRHKLVAGRGRPRKVIVPREFQVLGHTVRVMLTDQAGFKKAVEAEGVDKYDGPLEGYYLHSSHTIYLSSRLAGSEFEQTFLHELEHCILYSMGQDELSADERFTDLHAELFYQILKTQKGRLN